MRARFLGLVASLGILGSALVGAAPANSATPSGAISGKVTFQGSPASTSICVSKVDDENAGGCDNTDGNGDYEVTGLASGSYIVTFFARTDFALQYYQGVSSFQAATPVVVVDGQTTTGINAQMQPFGSISGTITDEVTGDPIAGVQVQAAGGGGMHYATSAADGTYTITSVPAGSYRILFTPQASSHALEYYDGTTDSNQATNISVTAGQATTGIDATLLLGGSISGSVSDANGPLQNVTICAFGGSAGSCAQSGANGLYVITGLSVGQYRVSVSSGNWGRLYYNQTPSYSAATLVSVAEDTATPNINFTVAEAATISGSVTVGNGGGPLAGVLVCATDDQSGAGNCANTDGSGAYSIGMLVAGNYKVTFNAPTGYATQYWNNKTSLQEATSISLTAGQSSTNINAVLEEGSNSGGSSSVPLCSSDAAAPPCITSVTLKKGSASPVSVAGSGEFYVLQTGLGIQAWALNVDGAASGDLVTYVLDLGSDPLGSDYFLLGAGDYDSVDVTDGATQTVTIKMRLRPWSIHPFTEQGPNCSAFNCAPNFVASFEGLTANTVLIPVNSPADGRPTVNEAFAGGYFYTNASSSSLASLSGQMSFTVANPRFSSSCAFNPETRIALDPEGCIGEGLRNTGYFDAFIPQEALNTIFNLPQLNAESCWVNGQMSDSCAALLNITQKPSGTTDVIDRNEGTTFSFANPAGLRITNNNITFSSSEISISPVESSGGGSSGGGSSGGGSSGGGSSGGGSSGGGEVVESPVPPVDQGTQAEAAPPVVSAPTPVVPVQIPQPTAVTAQEVASFSPEQLALVDPSVLRQFPPAAFRGISPAQVAALTVAQVNTIRSKGAAQLRPATVAALLPEQIAALRPAAVRSLRPAGLSRMSPEQIGALRPAAITRLRPKQLTALSPSQLSSMSLRQLRSLKPSQLARLTDEQLADLSRAQRRALGA